MAGSESESSKRRKRESVGSHDQGQHLKIIPDFTGLSQLFEEGHFSDLAIHLSDGSILQTHRFLLAASSQVLKTKFTTSFKDSTENKWSPDYGSAHAWKWIINWIYGRSDSLPCELVVEMLVLADQFQFETLLARLEALPFADFASDICWQLLDAWACPDVLKKVASICVPVANLSNVFLQSIQKAELPNVATVTRALPVLSEARRLRFLGSVLSTKYGEEPKAFPDCLLDVVDWHMLPTAALKCSIDSDMIDMVYFQQLLGFPLQASDKLQQVLLKGLANRCERLEHQLVSSNQTKDVKQSGIVVPSPSAPSPGLFSMLLKHQFDAKVELSTKSPFIEDITTSSMLTTITTIARKSLSTAQQSPADCPWIELKSDTLLIHPTAIGLKHAWSSNATHIRQALVVEATLGSEEWTELLSTSGRSLASNGDIFPITVANVPKRYFDRFRVRMTGPSLNGTWCLMLNWFDIFGQANMTHVDSMLLSLCGEPVVTID